MNTFLSKLLATSCFILSFSSFGFTDEIDKLNRVLNNFSTESPIHVELHSSFNHVFDGNKKSGAVKLKLAVDKEGFHATYDQPTLTAMASESAAKTQNEDHESPTINAASKLNTVDMYRMLSASKSIQQFLYNATFINATFVMEEGKSYQQLRFNIPMESLVKNKKTRQYVDEFESEYVLWLNDTDIPVKSHLSFQGNGSAYVIFDLEAHGETTITYQVVNNRLIEVEHISKNGNSSIFGDFERVKTQRLTVLPTP